LERTASNGSNREWRFADGAAEDAISGQEEELRLMGTAINVAVPIAVGEFVGMIL
jgi:hypothetical protein